VRHDWRRVITPSNVVRSFARSGGCCLREIRNGYVKALRSTHQHIYAKMNVVEAGSCVNGARLLRYSSWTNTHSPESIFRKHPFFPPHKHPAPTPPRRVPGLQGLDCSHGQRCSTSGPPRLNSPGSHPLHAVMVSRAGMK